VASIFRRKPDPPSGNIRIQVLQWREQIQESLIKVFDAPLYEGEAEMIESRIGKYRAALAIPETSLVNLRAVWPDGEPAYRKMDGVISDLHEREKVAREFFKVLDAWDGSVEQAEKYAPKFRPLLPKNRRFIESAIKKYGEATKTFDELLND